MTDKIVRADSSVISGIKSCTFKEQVNTEENLRFGSCAASSIEFEVFGAQANAVTAEEELTYYQTDDNGVDTKIGVFTAQTSIPSRNTYRVVAYDNIIKLDADFSEHLASIQSSFPMTLSALLAEVASVAGVTFGNSPTLASTTIQEFSASGVSCRQVVAWAAEMSGQFVRCDEDGNIEFAWYATRAGYSLRPTSGSSGGVTYVPYREGGLDYKNYAVDAVDCVAVKPPEEEDVAYIYPVGVSGNTYTVSDNLLLTNADAAVMNTVSQTLYSVLSAVSYRPFTADLFRFDNPYRAGDIVSVTDIQGVTFNTIVMCMTVNNSGAQISATGKENYDSDSGNVQKQLVNLASNIVRINRLKVDWADIEQAIIDTLVANNITAKNLTVIDDNGDVVAELKNVIVLGDANSGHAELDFNSLELFDQDGSRYLFIGDERDATGSATYTRICIGNGTETAFQLIPIPSDNTAVEVTIDGVSETGFTVASGVGSSVWITFNSAPSDNSEIVIVYPTTEPVYHYDFGTRKTGTTYGLYSEAGGKDASAIGPYSTISGGLRNEADGFSSTVGGGVDNVAKNDHAVVSGGRNNNASGTLSAVGGGYFNEASSFASGVFAGQNNLASKAYSAVVGGHHNSATGQNSIVAGGENNVANHKSQFVFGENNIPDPAMIVNGGTNRGNYIEIVGNGAANSPANARTLDWSGNETLAGTLYVNGADEVAIKSDIPAALSELSNDIGAMRYLGVNPIASAAEDTPESWAALGSGYAFFNTDGLLNGQPYRYGMLVSYVQAGASSMTQWFMPFGNNIPCIRASTSGGWYGNGWRELAEASAVLPAQPSPETITFSGYRAVAQGYASTSTNANVFMPMPNNASGAEVVRTGTWTLGTPSQASAAVSGLAVTQVTRAGIYLAATTTGLTTGEPATLKCVTNATMTITWS